MQTAVLPTRIRHGVYHVPGVGLVQGTRREAFQALEAAQASLSAARANLEEIERRQEQNHADLEALKRLRSQA